MEGSVRVVLDQMGRKVEVPSLPQRIVSLVPSQTELLYDLGLGDRVVGVTKFCIHPSEWHQSKTFVGGTKQFKFNVIDELKPDLIIGNKEENYLEGIEELDKKYPVWMSDITGLDEAFDMILAIGNLVDERAKSISIVEKVKEGFALLPYKSRKRALYLIWKKPYMGAGRATFIDEMMDFAGFENVLSETRYPELTLEAIQELAPEAILLSSEPYPFKEKHITELKAVLPNCDVQLVDGEMFSWYGSRLIQAPSYFANLK
ncbi:ABC-type Fe3+-hydroxamate transport system substrate-binding protein [Roseivirga ehrenbergii]|nr:helical backbone metal receptor [Roseivirga ehrenbergii]TCL07896.1 ABC-type Fe3+-hydroxamate transport system substrate-binding protein [Roseivirga ehrenbergii]